MTNTWLDQPSAHKLVDELKVLGLAAKVEEVLEPPSTYRYRVTTEPQRLDAAALLRVLALQYEHYSYCHLEPTGSISFSSAVIDAS